MEDGTYPVRVFDTRAEWSMNTPSWICVIFQEGQIGGGISDGGHHLNFSPKGCKNRCPLYYMVSSAVNIFDLGMSS